ncbi:hypothetical protein GSVR_32080 [Geobacter sp. SVR]|nr:hypothetical protein GSVR_32080 [Geobacter sp. SVR]
MTQPDEASCEILNLSTGNLEVKTKTPFTATLDASSGFFQNARYKIKLTKEGYLPYETHIDGKINGWYFGNVVFGGLIGILLVDPASGAMWKIYDDNINVKLYRDTPEGRVSMATEKYNGEEALKRQDYDGAIDDTTYGISVYPEFYDGFCVRSASYAAKGDMDKAMEDINKAISLKPEMHKAYRNRGELFVKTGKPDKAIEDFNKALALKPDYAEALFSRGYLYNSQNNIELAKADITLACKKGFRRACNFQF